MINERPTSEKPVGLNPSLDQPHFEDVRSIWNAREVIPLDEFEAHRHKQRWHMLAALALAMLLGAASGLMWSFFELRRGEVAQTNIESSTVPEKPIASALPEEPISQYAIASWLPKPSSARESYKLPKRVIGPRPDSVNINQPLSLGTSEDEELKAIRNELLDHPEKPRVRSLARLEQPEL